MLDNLQAIFWPITYLLIIIFGIKNRRRKMPGIPLFVALMNLGWEINALIVSRGFWSHILWLSLDAVIFILNLTILFSKKEIFGFIYIGAIFFISVLLFWIFQFSFGMLISVFIIDLVMAVEYVLVAKRISPYGKIPIAITKLIGDFCAWLYYARYATLIAVIGLFVFILNLYYLYCCITERKQATMIVKA